VELTTETRSISMLFKLIWMSGEGLHVGLFVRRIGLAMLPKLATELGPAMHLPRVVAPLMDSMSQPSRMLRDDHLAMRWCHRAVDLKNEYGVLRIGPGALLNQPMETTPLRQRARRSEPCILVGPPSESK
jgi:hypothetical protein